MAIDRLQNRDGGMDQVLVDAMVGLPLLGNTTLLLFVILLYSPSARVGVPAYKFYFFISTRPLNCSSICIIRGICTMMHRFLQSTEICSLE